jgi:membrane-associated protease RseP (regulator of RpoE activity)
VALFDVAAAGPGASILISILFTFLGLSLTITSRSLTSLPVVPAAVMKSSFLIGQIVTIVAPTMMLAPLSQPVPVHPLFLVGLAGLVFSAVNMLPIGRLDGGRACAAVFGRRVASLISFMSLIVLAYYSLFGGSGIAAFWGSLLILTRQRLADVPCVDEVTGVGDFRAYIYVGVSFLALLTLLPFMGGVGPI